MWVAQVTLTFLNPPVEMAVTILCKCRISMAFWIDPSVLTGHFEWKVHAMLKQPASWL